MEPSKKPGTFRYALIGAAIILIAGGILGVMQNFQIRRDINLANESNNVFLARVFANLVWPGIRDFVGEAHDLPLDVLKTHKTIRETQARALKLTRDVPLLKIKIYDLNGLTVFSTEPSQIGEFEIRLSRLPFCPRRPGREHPRSSRYLRGPAGTGTQPECSVQLRAGHRRQRADRGRF